MEGADHVQVQQVHIKVVLVAARRPELVANAQSTRKEVIISSPCGWQTITTVRRLSSIRRFPSGTKKPVAVHLLGPLSNS